MLLALLRKGCLCIALSLSAPVLLLRRGVCMVYSSIQFIRYTVLFGSVHSQRKKILINFLTVQQLCIISPFFKYCNLLPSCIAIYYGLFIDPVHCEHRILYIGISYMYILVLYSYVWPPGSGTRRWKRRIKTSYEERARRTKIRVQKYEDIFLILSC